MRVIQRSACAIALVFVPLLAQASPVGISFDLVAQPGSTGSGSGTAIVDDSLLAPSTSTISDFANLFSWTLMLDGLGTIPSSTSFAVGDLFSWILTTDAGGNIVDFNFRTTGANADDYGLNALLPATIQLCAGPTGAACAGGTVVSTYDIVNYDTFAVPEPATLLLLGTGLAVATTRRRRIVRG